MEVYLNISWSVRVRQVSTPLTAALADSCAVHHQFTSRFTLGALRATVRRAMVQPDVGIQSGPASKFELGRKNLEAT